MPDVDSTLRQIAQWKFLAVTDLTKSFYQIPLSSDSMKYCGVATPFRGVRVYARSAMGMPGSETALEELTCRVLGDLVQEGIVAKVADDLYCGGNTPEELLSNWRRVLQALDKCNLRLSASKTVIAPKQTTILGWIWRSGTLEASPHRVAALSTCDPPATVKSLRSFIGAYKVLSRVVKDASFLVSPLDDAVAGRDSKDRIVWTDTLVASFREAQKALLNNKSIILPRQEDSLWIVTDGALRKRGLGATLYVTRNRKTLLAGFYSSKLRKNQAVWLPCEIEALSIAAAIKHFAPYIIQSSGNTCVLTDSKPCVQAYEKLCRGEFSASPRVSTFLSTASRYQLSIRHVAGSSILPSDFASRNAADCDDPLCQICVFVNTADTCVVREVSVQEVINGNQKLPFTSRTAWLTIQSECPDLRRTHAHLKQGTRPSKKVTNIRDVKRYLNVASISRDGLLVVKQHTPFMSNQDRVVVPRSILDGLLMSLHIKLDHPSGHQLKTVVHRYFFALDMDKAVERTTHSCHTCAALQKVPHCQLEQSSCDPPESIGISFAADVLKRERQLILVVRECVTSFTTTLLLDDEKKETLRNALIQACIELRPLDGPHAVIRTDSAPGFVSLHNDELLNRFRITVECGRVKNKNKNPVAEKAIQELEDEILRQDRSCRTVSPLTLSLATARLNSRIRSRGLSAREMLLQRDQFSNNQIPLEDQSLISNQHEARVSNHPHSQRSKAPALSLPVSPSISVGDLVYLYCDRNKSSARDRYLVVSLDGKWCNIKKFVGSQLRSTSYRVKMSECYKVPSFRKCYEPMFGDHCGASSDDDYDECVNQQELSASECEQNLRQAPAFCAIPDTPEVISSPPPSSVNQPDKECDAPRSNSLDNHANTVDPSATATPLRRSTRNRCAPLKFKDYEV